MTGCRKGPLRMRMSIIFKEGDMAQAPVSPLTGIFEEDEVVIDFGDHEGKSVLEVSDTHPDFYHLMIKFKDEKFSEFSIRRGKYKHYLLNMNIPLQ